MSTETSTGGVLGADGHLPRMSRRLNENKSRVSFNGSRPSFAAALDPTAVLLRTFSNQDDRQSTQRASGIGRGSASRGLLKNYSMRSSAHLANDLTTALSLPNQGPRMMDAAMAPLTVSRRPRTFVDRDASLVSLVRDNLVARLGADGVQSSMSKFDSPSWQPPPLQASKSAVTLTRVVSLKGPSPSLKGELSKEGLVGRSLVGGKSESKLRHASSLQQFRQISVVASETRLSSSLKERASRADEAAGGVSKWRTIDETARDMTRSMLAPRASMNGISDSRSSVPRSSMIPPRIFRQSHTGVIEELGLTSTLLTMSHSLKPAMSNSQKELKPVVSPSRASLRDAGMSDVEEAEKGEGRGRGMQLPGEASESSHPSQHVIRLGSEAGPSRLALEAQAKVTAEAVRWIDEATKDLETMLEQTQALALTMSSQRTLNLEIVQMILELHQDKLQRYEAGKKRGLHVLPISHLEAQRSKLVLKKLSNCVEEYARASSELEQRAVVPRPPPRPTRELPTLYSGSERMSYGSEHQRSSFGIGSSRPPLAPSATRRFVNANRKSIVAKMKGGGGSFRMRMNNMREKAAASSSADQDNTGSIYEM